jgi:hypothetical protein
MLPHLMEGEHHATRRQVRLHQQAEAPRRAYRGGVRGSRRVPQGSRAPSLGYGEQGRQGRQEEWIGAGQEEHPHVFQEGRQERRRGLGSAIQGGALGVGPEGRGDAEAARHWEQVVRTVFEVVELAEIIGRAEVFGLAEVVELTALRGLVPLAQLFPLGAVLRAVESESEHFSEPPLSCAATTSQGHAVQLRRGPNHIGERVRFTAPDWGARPS